MSDETKKVVEGPVVGSTNRNIKAWCRSQSEAVQLEFEWFIEKYSLKPQKTGHALNSSIFSDQTEEDNRWYLQIFPGGWKPADTGFISLFLIMKQPKPKTVSYKFTLMNSKEKILLVDGPHTVEFNPSVVFKGEEKALSLQNLLKEENNFLPDDLLRIKCELAYETKLTTFSGVYPPEQLALSNETGTMTENFNQLLNSKSLSDVIIDIQGQTFEAHKLVLAARSPVFLAMFQTNLTEKQTNTLTICDIEADTFSEVLRFIYTDQVEQLDEMASKLLSAADKYMLPLLKAKCEVSLSRNISVETSGNLLILAHRHSSLELKKKVLNFIRCHSDEVVETTGWQELLQLADPQLLRDISVAMMMNIPSTNSLSP